MTPEYLRTIIHYSPETGAFTWLVTRRLSYRIGMRAGSINNSGYRIIRISGIHYRAHRLAWFYMTGTWPTAYIDHTNLNKDDNRWCNLRQATKSQNGQNRIAASNNTAGFKGVSFDKHRNLWAAYIKHNGRRMFLGRFGSPETAHAAYCDAARVYFGEFARL
jgi:hypothetical protein